MANPKNLQTETSLLLGYPVALTEETLAQAIQKSSAMHQDFRLALLEALTRANAPIRLELKWKSGGRPSAGAFGKSGRKGAQKIADYIERLVSAGVPRKAAVADACTEFKVSRATVFARLKALRETHPQLIDGPDPVRESDIKVWKKMRAERAIRAQRWQSKKPWRLFDLERFYFD